MLTVLYLVQIVLAITLTTVILLQVRYASLGSAFGGSDASIHHTRRGLDRVLYNFTIVLSILFGVAAVVIVLVAQEA